MTSTAPPQELWAAAQDDVARQRQIPTATYRVQFNRNFTFRDAIARIPYWKALGISHIYASPYFRARPESLHGYDIIDHNQLNPTIGTDEDYEAFVEALHQHGMGQILDTVPNHMGIGEENNNYWMDVLENGPSSPYATFFDIDWQPLKQEMANQVLLPILGDQYGRILENQELKLSYDSGSFSLHYWETRLPLAPRTYTPVLEAVLDGLLEEGSTEDEHVLELQSILTALSHLPPRTETDPARIAERHREKEIVKRRLNALTETYPQVQKAVDRVVERYNGVTGNPRSFDPLDELVRAQAYRLAYWRVAAEEINYRRFFDINDLAAISMEQPAVFEATHRLIMELLSSGKVNGLRIDHPDGLWDPAGYFRNLQRGYLLALARRHAPDDETWEEVRGELEERYEQVWRDDPHSMVASPLYVVVEKILGHGEELPPSWTVAGTSGYEFLNLVNGLFVDGANAKTFETIYSTFIKQRTNFNDLTLAKKKQIMLVSLVSEVNVLAHQLSRLAERNRYNRDFTLNSLTFALREVIACFPIYRTYIACGEVPERAVPYIENAINCAKQRNPVTDPSIFDFIRDVLLLKYPGTYDDEDRRAQQDWVQKFQQVTGPVMAKGLEDTAFYIYNRLISLNEVGGEPQKFGTSVAEFHRANAERQRNWPYTMLTTSTHDTKRSEDVRARIDVLSEMPREWRAALTRWSKLNRRHKTRIGVRRAPDRNEEYLLYQTLLGAWEYNETNIPTPNFVERMQGYMQKALKEAKVNTSWINPNQPWDAAVQKYVAAILDPKLSGPFLEDFSAFAAKVAHYGAFNALSQTVIKLTAPGVPDIYQGNETWDLSLVDPDNRRAVNYDRNQDMLDAVRAVEGQAVRELLDRKNDGTIKLLVTTRLLHLRHERLALFNQGSYTSISVNGSLSDHLVAFARSHGDDQLMVVTPRLLTGIVGPKQAPIGDVWSGNRLNLADGQPGTRYTNILTGEQVEVIEQDGATVLPIDAVLAGSPVAVLVRDNDQ